MYIIYMFKRIWLRERNIENKKIIQIILCFYNQWSYLKLIKEYKLLLFSWITIILMEHYIFIMNK